MRSLRQVLKFGFLSVGMCCLAASLLGQSSTEAGIRGTITDPSGAVIRGAAVTLTNVGTNISQKTVTDQRGDYAFRALSAATYKLLVDAQGFGSQERDNVLLTVNQKTTINVGLQPAAASTTVTVKSIPVLLDTQDASLGTDVSSKYLVQIPLMNRDPFALTFLAAGVTEVTGSGTNNSYPVGTNFTSNGQRNATASIYLDGSLTTAPEEGEGGTTSVDFSPTVEALQEFKVQNNSFSAEYGSNGGTVIHTVMKSGTNQIHGSAYWFAQRNYLDARDFFNTGPVPPHTQDQAGFSLGGPIFKDKTFYFIDYEGVRSAQPDNIVASVPTLQERKNGNFSDAVTYDPNGNVVRNQIFDPFKISSSGVRPAYTGNQIPQQELDPIGMKILNLYPAPNTASNPIAGQNNFRTVVTAASYSQQFDAKINQQFSQKSSLMARYSFHHDHAGTPSVLFDSAPNDGLNYTDDIYNDGLQYSYTPTPNTAWVSNFGLDRINEPSFSKTINPTSIGFPNYLNEANGITRMPGILVQNYTDIFDQCCVDTTFAHTLLDYSSSFSWVHGQHSFKFGGAQQIFYNNFFQPSYPTGYFSFDPEVTASTPFDTLGGVQGNSFADIAIGYGDSGGIQALRAVSDKSKETSFYAEDTWRVTSKLTLNLGVRYEWSTPYSVRHNISQFNDFTADTGVSVPGIPGTIKGTTVFPTSGNRTINVDRNNVGPRFGFAYQANDRMVIRGGGGVYYGMNVATNFQYPGPAFQSNPSMFFTKDEFQTRYATLANPFPNGIGTPQGTKYGKLAMWGLQNNSDLNVGTARSAEIYQWNLGIQQAFPASIVIGINYSANRSTHLPWGGYSSTSNRNFIASSIRRHYTSDELGAVVNNPFQSMFSGPIAKFNVPESRYGDAQIPLLNLLRPYPQFDGSFSGLPKLIAESWYNALEVSFQKRAGNYITFEGNYTWSKNEDDSSAGFNAFVGNLDAGNPQELDNLKAEHSISANDAPQRLVGAVIFQLPVGRGRLVGGNMNRVVDAVVGGWAATTLFTFQSGNPLGIFVANNRIADGNQRPNVVCRNTRTGLSNHDAGRFQQPYLNANCFADPGDQQAGNLPRYSPDLRADGIRNFDMTFEKNFSLPKQSHLELQANIFNVFNTPRMGFPDTGYEDSTFGVPSSTAPGYTPRFSQFGIRYAF